MKTATEPRPFHETVVEAIQRASSKELKCLATLIKATKIPQNHDNIIWAWKKRIGEMCWARDITDLPTHLVQQREAMYNKTTSKESIDLNDLQREVEKLLSLLTDRQTGHMSWHEFMKERLENIHKFTSRVLGK